MNQIEGDLLGHVRDAVGFALARTRREPLQQDRLDRMDPSTSLADLGIDSVALLDVVARLEDRTGIILSEDALARIGSVRDLMQNLMRSAALAG